MSKFVIREVPYGIKFALRAANGQVIATSETYSAEAACRRGIASVRKNAPIAPVEDQTQESFRTLSHPKFELYADKSGEYRFRLTARNGKTIAVSDGYNTRAGCINGIESVKKNAESADIQEE